MDLLFKREQSNAASGGVNFKLWGKIELDEDEKSIVSKYKFDQAILIFADQPGLLRKSIFIGIGAMVAAMVLLNQMGMMGALIALAAGIGAGYWWYHQKRETIYVKDLLHGRHFNCDSVVELARKEAWLETVVSFLRQVMESAKHWDGTERHTVEPLPKDEARQVIIKGL
jgi:hypothetical protein